MSIAISAAEGKVDGIAILLVTHRLDHVNVPVIWQVFDKVVTQPQRKSEQSFGIVCCDALFTYERRYSNSARAIAGTVLAYAIRRKVDENLFLDGPEALARLRDIALFSQSHGSGQGVADKRLTSVRVVCAPGKYLRERYIYGLLDLLVFDLEGAEREVIASFGDFDPSPTGIIFEREHISSKDEPAFCRYLKCCGYDLCSIWPDAIAIWLGPGQRLAAARQAGWDGASAGAV